MSGDSTVFVGDRVRTHTDGRARLSLNGGQRIEIGADTEVVVGETETAAKLTVAGGHVSFASTSRAPLRMQYGDLEVVSESGRVGSLQVMRKNVVGISALRGNLHVKRAADPSIAEVAEGTALVYGLDGEDPTYPGMPQGGTPVIVDNGNGKKIAIAIILIGGAAGAALAFTRKQSSASASRP